VRAYDLVKPHQEMEDGSVKRWLSRLDLWDLWDLGSFRGQTSRAKAWNVATRILPCLTWLARYQPKQLPSDIAAGVAVALLIIPQGLSYASIAGLPAIYGLYTDFVPLFFYFLYGTSMHLQVGAVAIVSLLTANTISELVRSDTDTVAALKSASAVDKLLTGAYNAASVALIERQIKTASLLAFFVGIFSFVIGILKLGSIMNLVRRRGESAPAVRGWALRVQSPGASEPHLFSLSDGASCHLRLPDGGHLQHRAGPVQERVWLRQRLHHQQ